MSRSGTAAPVGWAFLDYRHDGFTVRWKRGDTVAYVLAGQRFGDHGMVDVVDTVPVPPTGWTDEAEIRALGRRWMNRRERRSS